ncbi:hypothetical protein [Actinosynnema sp. NPDC023587]|uniref:hypothetical protein n=1 Tax=Actinosynnema sp. NPDC023587 TaxID=3154695 RepID=UPI0033D29295
MHELDHISEALASQSLNHQVFERCATDLLGGVYEGLSSVPGGTDWGRDADIYSAQVEVPMRVLVTASRTFDGVKANLVRGLRSMAKHGVIVERVVLANPADLSQLQRSKLENKAADWNVTIDAYFGREFFVSRLRIDGEWRQKLLGLSNEPITLSRTPADLAESPWAHLPLIGRESELAKLAEYGDEDVIVTGRPGVGKTRLLTAVEDIIFVDHDADSGKLADDLRWLRPSRVAVDDAGQHCDLVRWLVMLRRQEGDVLQYKIIAICWPDETDAIRDELRAAQEVEVDLLERSSVDQIIQAMGVTSTLARQQILDQAEGRPGWATTLADILTRTRRWESIVDGRVLLGEVTRYLRRASVGAEALDVLTAIAALGGITDDQIGRLATTLDLPSSRVRPLLLGVARNGLVDVSQYAGENGNTRAYYVRPPLLAGVLVAEHSFRSDVPVVKLEDLGVGWPEKLAQLSESAIHAARLGVESAVATATRMLQEVLEADGEDSKRRQHLVESYALIGVVTGRQVLEWITEEFDSLHELDDVDGRRLEPLVVVASRLVNRYSLVDGIRILLDAALIDDRPTNSNPNHPLRKIEDLVRQQHPELSPQDGLRRAIVVEAESWITSRGDSIDVWNVYNSVLSTVLSFQRSGNHANPADRHELILVETVLSPQEMQEVYDEIWPFLRQRLTSAPTRTVKAAIDAAAAWLRIGGGFDQPFGASHSADSIEKSAQLARALLQDLRPLTLGQPGLEAALRSTAGWFDVEIALDPDPVRDTFFAYVERKSDRREATERQRNAVNELVAPWCDEGALVVSLRLAEIKEQSAVVGRGWPSSVQWACTALANCIDVNGFQEWIQALLSCGLFPEAAPILEAAVSGGRRFATETLEECLATENARWTTLSAVFSEESVSSELLGICLARLQLSDYGVLEALFFGDRTPIAHRQAILKAPSEVVRGVAAMAMFEAGHLDDVWPPAELAVLWSEAINSFDPSVIPHLQDHVLRALLEYMAAECPKSLYGLFGRQFDRALKDVNYSVPHDLLTHLYVLPSEFKTRMMERYGQSGLRWALRRSMPGRDLEWLAQMLDSALLSPVEVLDCKDGLGGPEPSIPDLARLLVPRGVSPELIAYRAVFGVGWGEESDRLKSIIEQFEVFAQSDDASVALVGRTGVEIFKREYARAVEKERIRRIRGG